MEFEEYKNEIAGKSLEDLIEKIKSLDSYPLIESMLETHPNDATLVQATVMLSMLTDRKLSVLVNHVSLELTFSLIAQKLTAEILEEKEKENGSEN